MEVGDGLHVPVALPTEYDAGCAPQPVLTFKWTEK